MMVRSLAHPLKVMSLVTIMLTLGGCAKKISPDLEQAKSVLSHFFAPMYLQNSMFAAAYPECKPSQLVHYMFTSLAAAEMPLSEKLAKEEDREESEAMGMPLWPDGVAMVPLVPDPTKGRQLVLKHDDARSMIIVEAYEDPLGEPVATYEWQIEKVVPSEMAKRVFQSNVEMGAKY